MVWIVTTIHIMWRVDVKITKNVNKLQIVRKPIAMVPFLW